MAVNNLFLQPQYCSVDTGEHDDGSTLQTVFEKKCFAFFHISKKRDYTFLK